MDSIVSQIQAFANTADEAGRLNMQIALRKTLSELQGPKDVLMGLLNSNLLYATLRVGADLRLFHTLAEKKSTMTHVQLADTAGASPELIARIARYLASNNAIQEVGINEYQASNMTHVFASSMGEGLIYHGFDTHGPVIQAMPDFLASHKYQDVTSNANTPFQVAHNTKLQSFDWMVQNPEHFASLQKVMTGFEGAEWTVGLELLDSEAKKATSTPQASEQPFFVDVGGGHGHQCMQLGKKYPNLLGRLVLQDLPQATEKLAPIEGVRAEAYNFFEKEPITGAKFYYLRRIMHDWPDDDAVKILQNVASAMGSDSRLLIDEIVVPDTGAHWEAPMADLAMMNMCAGKERSKHQWLGLAERAGLRVEKIHTYAPSTYTSVLVLSLR